MIKRYKALSDTTITNAYKLGNLSRATGSNMGACDSLEVFALFNQESGASEEYSRILLKFDIGTIVSDRAQGDLPASGSVKFKLKAFDVAHVDTLPKGATLEILPVTTEWDEGYGKDLDNYTDPGIGSLGLGANWVNASSSSGGSVPWSSLGGDYDYSATSTQTIENGYENLDVDITVLVEDWISGARNNYGVGIKITGSQAEASSKQISYYSKKFSARTSEYHFSKPIIQAEFDDTIKDDRGKFTISSSFLSATDNINNLYVYNYVNGALKSLPVSTLYVKLFDSEGTELVITPVTPAVASQVSTGVYSCALAAVTADTDLNDVWYADAGCTEFYHSGSVKVQPTAISNVNTAPTYVTNITNLKSEYSVDEVPRLRVITRNKNVPFNVYTVSNDNSVIDIVQVVYRISRVEDDLKILDYLTGSSANSATYLSYDISGSYFDFDMNILQPGYSYKFNLGIVQGEKVVETKKSFKFRIIDEEDV